MSYAVPLSPPAKPRPTVVRVAVLLMWAVVAALVINIVLGLLPTPELDAALDAFYERHPEMQGDGSANVIGSVVGIAFTAAVAIALGVLAIFVGKGSQPARITTWVLGGLGVLCFGCGALLTAAAPSLLSGASGDEQVETSAELLDLIRANTPDWLYYTTTLLNIVIVVALIGCIILLAVPAANDYFRKEEQIWVPPTDPSAGGGFPQFPPPAVPQNPGAPPVPPAPPQYPPTQP